MKRFWIALVVLIAGTSFFLYSRSPRESGWKPRLIILLAIDTLRADHLGCYGYNRPTSPSIDRLASEGVLFENAFSQADATLGSFTSVFTGQYVRGPEQVNEDVPTIASMLRASGMRTLASVAGGHLNHGFGFSHGFDTYHDENNFVSLYHTEPAALDWLADEAADGIPTFLFLHGYDVHLPYLKPLGMEGLFSPGYIGVATSITGSGVSAEKIAHGTYTSSHREAYPLNDRDREHIAATYDGAIRYMDLYVGLLLERICRLGLEDQTLLIFTGDHGEQLLEKGYLGHGLDLDDRELHVPLIMWAPGHLPAGRRVSAVVELLDLFPSICDFAKCAPPPGLAGTSLRPLANGERSTSRGTAFALFRGATIRTDRYRLVLPPTNPTFYPIPPGLYAAADTAARVNLIGQPAMAGVVNDLRHQLDACIASVPPRQRAPSAGLKTP